MAALESTKPHQCCDLPWAQLYVHSSGVVFPCSFLQDGGEIGNVAHQGLREIWLGEAFERFRAEHSGFRNPLCAERQRQHACHLLHRDLRGGGVMSARSELPRRLDVMLDSACNLECVMCTSRTEPSGGLRSARFWTDNDDVWKALGELEVVGGEPLLSPHFYRLAEKLLELNPACRWRITTNANYPVHERLLGLLKRLNIETFAVSVDSLHQEIFEKIRKRSSFHLVMKNFLGFRDFFAPRGPRRLVCNFLVQDLNAGELPEVFRWAADERILLHPILLRHPEPHSVFCWNEGRRIVLIQEYLTACRELRSASLLHVSKMLFESLSQAGRLILVEEMQAAYGSFQGNGS